MYALYSLLTAVGMLLLSPYFLVRGLIQGKYLDNIPERLGWRFPPELARRQLCRTGRKIHLDSCRFRGRSAGRLAPRAALKERLPERRLVISTTTATGQKLARERMKFADAVFYFPLDWRGPVRRALRAARPAVVIIVETEIWPNFLRECRRAGVPVVFVNGQTVGTIFPRLPARAFLSGGVLRGFLKRVLGDATALPDAEREDADAPAGAGRSGRTRPGHRQPQIRSRGAAGASPLVGVACEELRRINRGPVVLAGSVIAE